MESETFQIKQLIAEELKEYQEEVKNIERRLAEQRQQRPYNIPYIKSLERELSFVQIQIIHYKDRLDKVDGCF